MTKQLKRLLGDESGTSTIGYILIAAVLAVIAIVAITKMDNSTLMNSTQEAPGVTDLLKAK